MTTDSVETATSGPAASCAGGRAVAIEGRRLAALYAVLILAVLFPMFVVDVVPLADLPNHMARIHILAQIDQNPALAAHYRVNWAVQPNLAMDLLLTPLARLVPVLELGRWFTVLTVLALVGGTLALHRALHGRIGLWPAVALLFVYNHALIWGFLNFLFGLGLAFGMLAAWIATADRAGWRRSGAFALACLGLYFVHLMSLGIYAALLGLWELGRGMDLWVQRKMPIRTWLLGAAQFIPAGLLVLAALPPSPGMSEMQWGNAIVRLRGVWSPVLTNVGPTDALLAIAVVATLLFGVLAGWFRVASGSRLPMLFLLGLALIVPFWIYGRYGGVWGLDVRLWIAMAFLATASTQFVGSRRVARILGTAGLVLLALRIYQIQHDWRIYDDQIREFRLAAHVIEPGSRVLQVEEPTELVASDPAHFQGIYLYLTTMLVIDRSAFVPILFTDPRKQPVIANPRNAEIDTPAGWPLTRGSLRAWSDPAVFDWFRGEFEIGDQRYYGYMWQDRFDYVVVLVQADGKRTNPVPEILEPVVSGSYFVIYRIAKRACTADYPGSCLALRAKGRHWTLPDGEQTPAPEASRRK